MKITLRRRKREFRFGASLVLILASALIASAAVPDNGSPSPVVIKVKTAQYVRTGIRFESFARRILRGAPRLVVFETWDSTFLSS